MKVIDDFLWRDTGYDGTLSFNGEDTDTSIKFLGNDNTPILELKENGDILVHGELIENDKQVVDAMREFITQTK